MQPKMCSKCKKNIAVVFITKVENGVTMNEGYCLKCARSLGIPQIDQAVKQMGISDEDLDMLSDEMSSMFGQKDDSDSSDDDEIDSQTATFPLLNQLFGGSNTPAPQPRPSRKEEGEPKEKKKSKRHKFLDSYCMDLTGRAREGKLDKVIGRDVETERVIQILNRRQKNNPCLIGEPGVGKTAIAEGLAQRIVKGDVPGSLKDKTIFALDMGVRGAALATILSQGLSCIWVLRFLTGPKTLLRLKKENVRFRPALILPCVALGTATFIMQASESVISVCFNSSLLKYGDDIAVGAMTILSSVMQFAMLPLQGIAQGAQPITSYNYGARNTQRVRQTFRLLLKVCLCYSVALWAVIQLCPGAFARIFTPNAALVAFTVPALRIYCGVLFLFGIQIACQMTFVSIGAAGCSIIVAVLRKFVLLLPLIYLMPRLLADQTMAVYTAEPVADAIAVTCTAILFAVQFRKALRKLDTED